MDDWPNAIARMESEYRSLVAAGKWTQGPADVFGIVGLSRSELHHSAMLAWLLDPTGRHGMGECFALAFTELVAGVPRESVGVRRVQTEVQRRETRADIVVWAQEITVVIEVKVDAGEGMRQCDRLFERFSAEPGSRFVFLTPSGTAPSTATGPAATAFVPIAWHQVADLLASAMASTSCRSTAVVGYLETLRREF